jgi:hypothetical protein
MASDGVALYEVDPCACTYEKKGSFPGDLGSVFGIAPDEETGLFAVSATAGALVRVDPDTADAAPVGALGVGSFNQHGLAWSEAEQQLYLVTDEGDALYTVDKDSGIATEVGTLTVAIGTVGVEVHPDTDRLYVCGTTDGVLNEVSKTDASTTPMASGPATCTNLGAPWSAGGAVCIPPAG